MKTLITLVLITSFSWLHAQQRAEPDKISTNRGDLVIQPITHGTLVLSWNGVTIYVDPYGGAKRFEGLKDPDIILITDIHGDHLNQETLNELNTTYTRFYVPQAVKDKLPEAMQARAMVISNGDNKDYQDIKIEAIPMYNLPDDENSRHKKGRGNGYILTMAGKRLYLSGDTEDIPEMRALTNIDVAFVCMNLPFTMDIKQAASAVNEFKPKIIYPYHYRGRGGLSDVEAFKEMVTVDGVEVRLKNWYPETK